MHLTCLFALGLFALSAQADLFVAQDLGYGNVVYTSTSPRLSANTIYASNGMFTEAIDTIYAPTGMYATSIWLPEFGEGPGASIVYQNFAFVSDFVQAGPSDVFEGIEFHNKTSLTLYVTSTFGTAISCESVCGLSSGVPQTPGVYVGEIVWGSDSGESVTDTVEVQYVGPQPLGTISGNVYNNLPDYPTHPPLANQTVELLPQSHEPLFGSFPITTTTDAEGNYSFTGLPAGSYEVIDPVPSGISQAFTGTDPTGISLAWNQNVSNVDFGDGYKGTGYIPEPASVWLLFTILFPIAFRSVRCLPENIGCFSHLSKSILKV